MKVALLLSLSVTPLSILVVCPSVNLLYVRPRVWLLAVCVCVCVCVIAGFAVRVQL